MLVLVGTACSNNEESTDADKATNEVTQEESTDQEEETKPEYVLEDNDPSETEMLGDQITGDGEALPDGLVGSWTVVSGMPEGLKEYTLIINPDGLTTQYTEANDGVTSSYDAYTVSSDGGYYITDLSGSRLMTLNYSNGSLTTYGLTGSETVFQKI